MKVRQKLDRLGNARTSLRRANHWLRNLPTLATPSSLLIRQLTLNTWLRLSAEPSLNKSRFANSERDIDHSQTQRDIWPQDWQSWRMNSANPASPIQTSLRPLAVVSGGSRGLGFETARGLAASGYDLALIAKDASRLSVAKDQLLSEFSTSQSGLNITTHAADLESQEVTRKVAEEITASLPTPQVMVLAHGVMSEKMSKTLRTTDAEWNRVMEIN